MPFDKPLDFARDGVVSAAEPLRTPNFRRVPSGVEGGFVLSREFRNSKYFWLEISPRKRVPTKLPFPEDRSLTGTPTDAASVGDPAWSRL